MERPGVRDDLLQLRLSWPPSQLSICLSAIGNACCWIAYTPWCHLNRNRTSSHLACCLGDLKVALSVAITKIVDLVTTSSQDGDRDRPAGSTRAAMPDRITEDLADQQDSHLPTRVPRAEYLAHEFPIK